MEKVRVVWHEARFEVRHSNGNGDNSESVLATFDTSQEAVDFKRSIEVSLARRVWRQLRKVA